MARSTFKKYLLPGMVFQSVVIAGGYGTGREIVEFFLTLGPVGGMVAMLGVSMVIWSLVCAVTFELARLWQTYDYRTFFRALIGKGWIAYELLVIASIPLVVAVNGSAAGAIMADQFELPAVAGGAVTFAAVILLSYLGRRAVERSLMFVALALVLVAMVAMIALVASAQ